MAQQDISTHRFTGGKLNLRRFHQARWDEPVIFELSREGQRGLLVPEVEEEIKERVGDVLADLPDYMRRQMPELMPKVMDNLMPHMIADVVPLVTRPMIDHLRRS